MKILVINSGSSSIKFQLIDTNDRKVLGKGLIERIGIADSVFTYEPAGRQKTKEILDIHDHRQGIGLALERLTDPEKGVISKLNEIEAVGHRIVHGGEKITKSEALTPEVITFIEQATKQAPLHNPANLMGLEAVRALLPDIPHVGVFDTAFHASMPEKAFIYALPYRFYEEHSIRRFGFHGTSHQYVSMRAAQIMERDLENFNCITCHLGNGVSLTAIKGGRSVDTTLGFGTMCGVPMGTRAGDLDSDIIIYLQEELGMSAREVHNLIYKESGLKGVSGLTNDMRDVEQAAEKGHKRAQLALDIFAHHARKYIGALATQMEGRLDAIVFTAGVGENGWEMRSLICRGLEIIGAELDEELNKVRGKEAVISKPGSKVTILAIPTNEELMIALDTEAVVGETN